MPDINQAWLALIGALLGGSGLKVLEYWLNRSKSKDDTAAEFRKELRDDVTRLRSDLRNAEVDADQWRTKYYELMDEYSKLKRSKGGT